MHHESFQRQPANTRLMQVGHKKRKNIQRVLKLKACKQVVLLLNGKVGITCQGVQRALHVDLKNIRDLWKILEDPPNRVFYQRRISDLFWRDRKGQQIFRSMGSNEANKVWYQKAQASVWLSRIPGRISTFTGLVALFFKQKENQKVRLFWLWMSRYPMNFH